MNTLSFIESMKRARSYGLSEFMEIMGELSQESTKKGHMERKCKELVTLAIALSKDCNRCIRIHTDEAKKLGATEEELKQVRKIVLFLNASPSSYGELWDSWEDAWRAFALARGAIIRAHRELIALAISIVKQRSDHIDLHVKEALKHGISAEHLFEVMPIALLMDGAPALSQIPYLVNALVEPEAESA